MKPSRLIPMAAAAALAVPLLTVGNPASANSVSMELTSATDTGATVTPALFGGNIIGGVNTSNDGVPRSTYVASDDAADITVQRFPAGRPDAYFDGAIVDAQGDLLANTTNFLDWARSTGRQAMVVLPTNQGWPGDNQVDQFTDFAERALTDYPDVVIGFEVGNEYWGRIDEITYGQRANAAVNALAAGMQAAGSDADVLVQMANPTGRASRYRTDPALQSLRWVEKLRRSQADIYQQLDPSARATIDGVVEHYYFNRNNVTAFADSSQERVFIDFKHNEWVQAFGRDVELHLTEWNVSRHSDQVGMRGASVLFEQFENMLEMGVDAAQVWATESPNIPTRIGSAYVVRTDSLKHPVSVDGTSGLIDSSIHGAAFDMMSSNLVGMNLIDAQFTNDDGSIEINTYSDGTRTLFQVSSRTNATTTVDLDVSALVPTDLLVVGTKIGTSTTIDDDWAAPVITVLGDAALGGGADVTVTLAPFEVIELRYDPNLPQPGRDGSNGADRINGTNNDDTIHAYGGNDRVNGRNGDDWIDGGSGDDWIAGGRGNDEVYGGDGNDTVAGWGGDDYVDGGPGNDHVSGQQGVDVLVGGDGNDALNGGTGADSATGGPGADRFVFKASQIAVGDRVEDFEPRTDVFRILVPGVSSTRDLTFFYDDAVGAWTIGFDQVGLNGTIHVFGVSERELDHRRNFVFS